MPHAIHQSPHNHSGIFTPHQIQETNSLASDEGGVIYGTNISMKNVVSSLENFIVNFEVTRLVDGTSVTEKIYRNQLYDL